MAPLTLAGFALTGPRLRFTHSITRPAVTLTHSPLVPLIKSKTRHINMRDRDRNGVFALAADHLTVRDVIFQTLADPTADDIAESIMIAIDLKAHGATLFKTADWC